MAHELISADSHVNPPPTMWAEYLPAQWRDRAPVIEKTDDGVRVCVKGRPDTEEVIPFDVLTASVNRAA